MKKTIKSVLVAAVAMVMGMSVFAEGKSWTNFFGFGMSFPADMALEFDGKDNLDLKKGLGLGFNYTGIRENGFAFTLFEDSSYVEGNVKHTESKNIILSNEEQSNHRLMLGFGYSPVNTDHFTLAAFGTIGLNIISVKTNLEYKNGAGEYTSEKYTDFWFAPVVGGTVTMVLTPIKCFSLYGSCCANYVVPGVYYESCESLSEVSSSVYFSKGTWEIIPVVGICWRM